jgi:hypothetical protein
MVTNGGFTIQAKDVRLEHLTIRSGDSSSGTPAEYRRAVTVRGSLAQNVVLKNLSLSWGVDSNITTVGPIDGLTVEDSIVAESLWRSIHPAGARGNGVLIGERARGVQFIGNLLAANMDRNIRWKYDTRGSMINNVIYGWGGTSSWNTTNISDLDEQDIPVYLDLIGNIFRAGPNGLSSAYGLYSANTPSNSRVFLSDNVAPRLTNVESRFRALTRIYEGAPALPAAEAYDAVLAKAGARPWDRSADDRRIVAGVRAKSLTLRDKVGTWPTYAVNKRAVEVRSDPISEDELADAMALFEGR